MSKKTSQALGPLYWGNPKQQGTKSWQALNINGPFFSLLKNFLKITPHIERLTTISNEFITVFL
jgi:hypothetical protein